MSLHNTLPDSYVVDGVTKRLEQLIAAPTGTGTVYTHNHPSGVAEPSNSDSSITHQLVKALDLIDVRVLDHVVVGMEGCVSFAESGLL